MPDLRGIVVAIILFPVRVLQQLRQIAGGVWSYATEDFSVNTFVPDWLLRITVYAIPKALFGSEPKDQIEGSIILIGWSIATSLFTGFATVFFVLFWSVFLVIGVVRFSDWGSTAWSKVSSPSLPGKGSGGSYQTRKGK